MTETQMRELDAWIAEYLFGWTWWERDMCKPLKGPSTRKALFPPDDNYHIRWNFGDHWRPARSMTPRFSDWDICGSAYDPSSGRSIEPYGIPFYSSNSWAAMTVFKKCAMWVVHSHNDPISVWRRGKTWHISNIAAYATGKTLELAIARFARNYFRFIQSQKND